MVDPPTGYTDYASVGHYFISGQIIPVAAEYDTEAPSAALFAPDLEHGGGDLYEFFVVYDDDVALDIGSIDDQLCQPGSTG